MTRKQKPSGSTELKSGNDFIGKAQEAGAKVQPHRDGFIKVSTRQGSTYIVPGDQPLDLRTRKNLRHWFRLLGLLAIGSVFVFMIDLVWGLLQLPSIW